MRAVAVQLRLRGATRVVDEISRNNSFLPRNFISCLTKQKNNVAETKQEIAAAFSSPLST
jgi:hypothetical protein